MTIELKNLVIHKTIFFTRSLALLYCMIRTMQTENRTRNLAATNLPIGYALWPYNVAIGGRRYWQCDQINLWIANRRRYHIFVMYYLLWLSL